MTKLIDSIVDLEKYPLHSPNTVEWHQLVEQCRQSLKDRGMYELPGFLKPKALNESLVKLLPRMASESVEIRREHNIYFLDKVEGLSADHPALKKILTTNHTLCADQLTDTCLTDLYEWPNFRMFVAATMEIEKLHLMDDELARLNILSYRPGEALNWHFDRSEFTITLL